MFAPAAVVPPGADSAASLRSCSFSAATRLFQSSSTMIFFSSDMRSSLLSSPARFVAAGLRVAANGLRLALSALGGAGDWFFGGVKLRRGGLNCAVVLGR